MKITFEATTGSMYIYLSDKKIAYTEELGGIIADYDKNKQVVGIEILDTNMPEVEII